MTTAERMQAMAELQDRIGELRGVCEGLYAKVVARLRALAGVPVFDHEYAALTDRVSRAGDGVVSYGGPSIPPEEELRFLRDELNEMLSMDAMTLRVVVRHRSPRSNAFPAEHLVAAHRFPLAPSAPALPRVQPAELVQRFAARGVVIQALDGNLHVTPAEALTVADREVLAAHKSALLAVLAQPAAVV